MIYIHRPLGLINLMDCFMSDVD